MYARITLSRGVTVASEQRVGGGLDVNTGWVGKDSGGAVDVDSFLQHERRAGACRGWALDVETPW